MRMTGEYLTHLERESARFAAAMRSAAPHAQVPSCPEWTADDLLWHLGKVQWFWGSVIREKVVEGAEANRLDAGGRPTGWEELFGFFDRANRELLDQLTSNPAQTPAWTWSAEQSVGFIRRRQAHEALIHRADAELTIGERTPMDPRLCADGIDEVLRIMYGGAPAWARTEAHPGQTLRFRTTDTGDSWLVTVGRLTGVDPRDASAVDEPWIDVAAADSAGEASATIAAAAADMDCWLWNRPAVGPVEQTGDPAVLDGFASVLADGLQ